MRSQKSIEDSDKLMRASAIDRLKREHGILLSNAKRNMEGIATAIRRVAPQLDSGDAATLVRAWLTLRPENVAPAKLIPSTGRKYEFNRAMRYQIDKLNVMHVPVPVNMSTKVSYSAERMR